MRRGVMSSLSVSTACVVIDFDLRSCISFSAEDFCSNIEDALRTMSLASAACGSGLSSTLKVKAD